jgi:hypothetical protein
LTDRVTFAERVGYVWYSSPLEGLHDQFDVSLALGTWYEKVLVAGSIGVTWSNCPTTFCPTIDTEYEGETNTGPRVAVGPSGTFETSFWPLEYGYVGAGLGVRYWASRTSALTHEGDRVFWTHGPRFVPKLCLNEKDFLLPGVPAGTKVAVLDLEAPLGVNLSARGTSTFVYGVGVRIGVTVW